MKNNYFITYNQQSSHARTSIKAPSDKVAKYVKIWRKKKLKKHLL